MKITDMRIEVVRRELPATGLQSDLGAFSGETEQGVLRVFTDEGIEGNCFVGEFRRGGHRLFDPILNVLKPALIGRDPADREWLWTRLGILGRRRGMSMAAWAPVDVALWDISGKAAGVPIYKLLGAQHYETEVYATYPPRHESPDGYVREADEIAGEGFRAYKIHPGVMSARDVIETVERVRDLLGDEMQLMLDPNNGYNFRKAFEIGRALDDLGFFWYEDPVPPDDYDAIVELSQRLDTPLCMSDAPENQFSQGAHYIRLQALRLVRGTARKLGITGLKKLCSLAEGFGMNCEIGTAGNSTLNAANLHVIFSVSNCDYFEFWMPQAAHQFGLVEDIARNERGVIEAPTLPGIGYALDWDWIEKHQVATLE
ncbi:MAG: mandelate racemase [Chloroflexi bacterium]|nr:mandelate racemase [Chloroflexota bacterium]